MNLTSSGKSMTAASCSPRHSTGISFQASPSFLPAKGPVAISHSVPVSQASPIGSCRFDLSGKRGANERAPQILGLKMGSMRVGVGFTRYHALACGVSGAEKRQLGPDKAGINCRTPKSDSGFSARKKAFETPQAFLDALDGCGVRKPQIAGRAESFARNDSDLNFVQQHLCDFRARFRKRWSAGAA